MMGMRGTLFASISFTTAVLCLSSCEQLSGSKTPDEPAQGAATSTGSHGSVDSQASSGAPGSGDFGSSGESAASTGSEASPDSTDVTGAEGTGPEESGEQPEGPGEPELGEHHSRDTAKDMGDLGGQPRNFGNYLLASDKQAHYYRFRVARFGRVFVRVKQQSPRKMELNVYSAQSNANQSESLIEITHSQADGNADYEFALPRGEYFVAMGQWFSSAEIQYSVSMFTVSGETSELIPEPGNHFDEAHDLGALPLKAKFLEGYVGIADRSDYYRFQAPADSKLQVHCVPGFGDYSAVLYREENSTGTELGVKSCWGSSASDPKVFDVRDGGAFYLKVEPHYSNGSLYKVAVDLEKS